MYAMTSSGWLSVFIFVAATFVDQGSSHVRLTYPPARQFALDFLDNSRTVPPCGMKAGYGEVTDLEEAATFNVSWHMAYVHNGGYKIELLEGSTVKHTLTPGDGFVGSDDTTTLIQNVSLPAGYTCNKCTLRIVRQAGEWGSNYRFWSCADVNIKSKLTYSRKCSGHGTLNGNECECAHLYSGDECQHKDECVDDTDCSDYGSCIDTESSFYPRRQCFCQAGWFGADCKTASTVKTLKFDPVEYYKHEMSKYFHVYSKIVKDELEVIIQATGTSYVALGWRPLDTTASCSSFPTETDTNGGAAEPEATAPPQPEATAPPQPEATAAPHPESTAAQPEPQSSTAREPENAAAPAPEGTASLHQMDCTDIIIGSARGKLSRVGDYYTRDRSSPRSDAFYGGGKNSLTAAIGQEENGITTILFRRKLRATEKQDHHIIAGKMHVIWAKGQEKNTKLPTYYRKDELKYHGGGTQRGWKLINFHDERSSNSDSAAAIYGFKTIVTMAVGVTLGLLLVTVL